MAYGTRRFNGTFTTQFLALTLIYLKYILILSFHIRLGHPEGLFLVGLPVKILKALLPGSILATLPVYHILIFKI